MYNKLKGYCNYLLEEEKSENTRLKYIRDVKKFLEFINNQEIEKKDVLAFKEKLMENYEPTSINSILVAVNSFLEYIELPMCRVKPLKIQKEIFSKPEKELSEREYKKLIKTAEERNNSRLALIIQTICSTGIRISELKFITVESLKKGRVKVQCKGKSRTIFIPKDFCKILILYCKKLKIYKGTIFISKNGKPLDRSNIWKMMKNLCKVAKVETSKVFPHNLRHLFARTYYKINKDISRLADILGHSSVNTTRIYIMETGITHIKQLEKMNLISTKITT